MLPIRDDQPCTTTPWVNYFIIAANVTVFGYQLSLGLHSRELYEFYARFGAVPHNFELAFAGSGQVTLIGAFLTILTSMFVHGSVLHLLGNVWVLWIFGDNIEDHLGHVIYPIFYLVCGVLASMTHIYANPSSQVPSIGASGAIAGVMGAFLLRYPQARVQLLVNGLRTSGGVSYWAHVGGFVTGMILIKVIPGHTQYSHGGWFTKEGKEVLPKQ